MSARLGYELERRTVKHLETVGYRAERVSRAGLLNGGDLFGIIDVIAVNSLGVELIQVTTATNASHRRRKIREARLPWPVRLWLWKKVGGRWTFRSEEVLPVEAEAV